MSTNERDDNNLAVFRDCLAEVIISAVEEHDAKRKKQAKRGKKRRGVKAQRDSSSIIDLDMPNAGISTGPADDMAEFIEYLASEIFANLPDQVQTLTYSVTLAEPNLTGEILSDQSIEDIANSISPSVIESLETYDLPSNTNLLSNVLPTYIASVAAPPPIWVSTRPSECELCQRDWIPLTYHHLIPRSTHDKVLKRGWHEEWELNKVAWLCSACHRCVHRVTTNEDLAQNYHTIESLLGRDDIQSFVKWVGGVRWKKR